MSGICGILRLDGGVASGIAAMTDLLERRGPDGTHHHHQGPCALGHTLLATTPESQHEILPLTDAGTGCTITADVRLDNRDALLPALGLASDTRIIGDGELILLAYLRWGPACLDHLLGDFAFAIWDPRTQRLFAARDQIGLRQFIYHHQPGAGFVFATEPRAVLAAGVGSEINEGRIAEFLEGNLEAVDLTSTFFNGILRLPPAHSLILDAGGLVVSRYWRLVPGPALTLPTDAAYEAAFHEVFAKAIASRLRAPAGTVGSMLSGGMDSGSIVAVAARLFAKDGRGRFPTFSGIGPDPETCVESRAILQSLTMPNLDPHLVNWADMPAYADDLIRLTRAIDDPFDGHMTILRAVYRQAQLAGIKVLFDGVGGDLCFANTDHIPRLIRRLRWREAWRETRLELQFWKMPALTLRWWLIYQRRAWTPGWMRRLKRRALRLRRRADPLGLCRPDFAGRVDLATRQSRNRDHALLTWVSHRADMADLLQSTHLTAGRERYDRIASACGIEPRDPFLDLRVINFCITLPMRQLTRDGWPKFLLRQAMAEYLPDAVRWRRGHEHLGEAFSRSLAAQWPGWPDLPASDGLACYVDLGLVNDKSDNDRLEDQLELLHLGNWLTSLSNQVNSF